MLTSQKIRTQLVACLNEAVARPGMFGGELYFRLRVQDLAAIEECSDQLQVRLDQLSSAGILTSVGVRGWFLARMPLLDDFSDEVASVYARIGSLFGWIEPTRLLEDEAYKIARRFADRRPSRDLDAAEVVHNIGEPSVIVGDIHAYASARNDGWIYFDYTFDPPEPGHYARQGVSRDRWRLRNVRLPISDSYSERLRFTPLGRVVAGR